MTQRREAQRAYSITSAAELKDVSPDAIRRAIRATKGNVLKAKKIGSGYRINASDLEAWWDGLADA